MSSTQVGQQFETWVCQQLTKLKYKILISNFRSQFGEIDIIALDQQTLVFIEVKARTSTQFGQPYEAVNKQKLDKITKTGHYFRQKNAQQKLPSATRIDVASILINAQGKIQDFQLLKNVTR